MIIGKIKNPAKQYRLKFIGSVFVHCGVFFFSSGVFSWHESHTHQFHFSKIQQHDTIYKLKLIEPWERKNKKLRGVAEVTGVKCNSSWQSCKGRVVVYADSTLKKIPQTGGLFLFKGHLKPIEAKKNPDDFDYKNLMSKKRIYHSAFLKFSNWKNLDEKETTIKEISTGFRNYLCAILKSRTESELEYSISTALVLGERSEMDQEIIQAFSATGTIHVLSVSGMHVGMIYLALLFLVSRLPKNRFTLNFSTTIIILFLWAYAFLTGLSPSVLRAVTMLSLIVLGNAANMRPNIYNTLAASAFLLICLDPTLLSNAGFQLSYLAVLGIVVIHPLIYEKLYFQKKWQDKIWTLISVSMAAQLTTFPLALFHFGNFPNYFLISNLIIIPLASGVLFIGIAVLFFAFVPLLGDIFSFLLKINLKLLIETVNWFSSLPGAQSTVWLSATECILIYMSILFLLFHFENISKKSLTYALYFLLSAFIFRIAIMETEIRKNKVIIASIKNQIIIEFEQHPKHQIFVLGSDNPPDNFTLSSMRSASSKRMEIPAEMYCSDTLCEYNNKPNDVFLSNGVLCFADYRIALAAGNRKFEKKLAVDALLVSGLSPYASVRDIENFYPRIIVADGNCTNGRIKKWEKAADDKGIPFYSIKQNGALSYYFP